MNETKLPFEPKAMELLIQNDRYLSFVFRDLLNKGHEQDDLKRILFHSEVVGDSLMAKEYEKALSSIKEQ